MRLDMAMAGNVARQVFGEDHSALLDSFAQIIESYMAGKPGVGGGGGSKTIEAGPFQSLALMEYHGMSSSSLSSSLSFPLCLPLCPPLCLFLSVFSSLLALQNCLFAFLD